MERMPYGLTAGTHPADAGFHTSFPETVSSDWRRGLPVLTGAMVRLREMR